MAYDKVVDSGKLDAAMTATANAIRAKGGSADKIDWDETTGFSFNVSKLPEPTKEVEQATPSISVDSAGKITASATQSEGYVSAGTKSATKQLTTQAAKTVTPSTTDQTAVESGRYTTGAVKVKGDANLKAENIAEGVSIFGVTGTHAGGATVGSVNLHNTSTDIVGVYLSNGAETTYSGWSATDYIPVKAGKHYIVYSSGPFNGKYCFRYAENKSILSDFLTRCVGESNTAPILISGHNGYLRYSSTSDVVADLVIYEVTGLVWEEA